MSKNIFSAACSLDNAITLLADKNKDITFDPLEVLFLADIPSALTFDNPPDLDVVDDLDPTIWDHEHRLIRNLSSFNLVLNRVPKDGDCAFTSVVRSLSNTYSSEDKEL